MANATLELSQVNLDNNDVNRLTCTLVSSPKYETFWCAPDMINDNQIHFPYNSIMRDDFSCYSTNINIDQGVWPGPIICGRSGYEIAEVLDHNRVGYAPPSSNTEPPSDIVSSDNTVPH